VLGRQRGGLGLLQQQERGEEQLRELRELFSGLGS
jgi:hypothetical protein